LVSGSDFYIQQREAASVIIATNGADRATIDSAGNLGLGVTPSTWSIGKAFELNSVGCAVWSAGTKDIRLVSNVYYASGDYKYASTGTASMLTMADDGAFRFYNAVSGSTGGTIAFSERARIDDSGNLLVGTTTAVEKLTVAGNISISTSGNPFLQIKTSGAGNNPYIRLQADTVTWDIQGTFSNAGDELYLIYAGSNRGYFNSSTGAYTAVSDQRLKKNITDISYGLDAILNLRPVEYLMNDENDNAQKHLGFIAQEAQTAVPSSVSEMTDGMFGMDKTELIAVLVKGMQEQQAKITQLQADIAALKG